MKHVLPVELAYGMAASLVCLTTCVKLKDVIGTTRGTKNIADARMLAVYLASRLGYTRTALSGICGRARPVIQHAIDTIVERRADPEEDLWLTSLERVYLRTLKVLMEAKGV